ncbi:hypothetical protein Pelo_15798 [Pelomyxa schiedti]|nr:hypothetical protein Pelo_15798 [Pelomyxa schiedti]
MMHGPGCSAERLDLPYSHGSGRRGIRQEPGEGKGKKGPEDGIFWGCSFYFEGYTDNVSAYHLRKLVLSNGGSVQRWFSKSLVSHVICTGMSASKMHKIISSSPSARSRACGPVMVTPGWILASCKAGALAPLWDYRPEILGCENRDDTNSQEPPPQPLSTQSNTTTTTTFPQASFSSGGSNYPLCSELELATASFYSSLPQHPTTPSTPTPSVVLVTSFTRSSEEKTCNKFFAQPLDNEPRKHSSQPLLTKSLSVAQSILKI